MWMLRIPSVMIQIEKDTSPKHFKAYPIIRNPPLPGNFVMLQESMIRRGHVRIDSGGGSLSIVVTFGFINRKKSMGY